MMMMVEWELMGRDRGEMAGDITYTCFIVEGNVASPRQDSGGGALAPFFYRYKLCTPLWALDRWQSVGHVLASVQQVQKLRRRPKTAPFVPEMSVVV